MAIIGVPGYISKYGAESFQARNEGYMYPAEDAKPDSFNHKYKKKQDPTSGILGGIVSAIGILALIKNRKKVAQLPKIIIKGAKNFYNKLNIPDGKTIKAGASKAVNFVSKIFSKKP